MKLEILGVPLAKQSARFAKRGKFMHKYQPKKIIDWQEDARNQIRTQLNKNWIPIRNPVIIKKLIFKFPPLKNWSKKKLKSLETGKLFYKTTKPDIDNLIKSLDVLNGLVFLDDSQIVKFENVMKIFSNKPGIEIEFSEII